VVAALLLATACSDSKSIDGADAETGTATLESSTTVSSVAATTTTAASTSTIVVAETTAVPATAPPAPDTTSATTLPPGGGGGGGLLALGTVTNLRPSDGTSVVLPSGYVCDGSDPGIPGWTVQECQQMPSYNDGVTTLVMRRNDDGRYGVVLLFKSGSNLVDRLMAFEPGPGTWSGVTVSLGDFHFDDGAEIWVGYRYEGTGQYLDLDVVDPLPGGVFFRGGLQGLDHGVVDLHPGGATVQDAVYGPTDPGCCPSQFRQREISFVSATNQWRINAGTTYPAAATPPITGDL